MELGLDISEDKKNEETIMQIEEMTNKPELEKAAAVKLLNTTKIPARFSKIVKVRPDSNLMEPVIFRWK